MIQRPEPGWGLLLFSHGSLLCGAGEALMRHADRLRDERLFGRVEVGFLNYSAPSFDSAVARFDAAGIQNVVVAPFFLVPGYFVTSSLPRKLGEVATRYPRLRFEVASCLGADERLADALIESGLAPMPEERWRDGFIVDPETCLLRPECPVRESVGCPAAPPIRRRERPSHAQASPSDALLVLLHGSPKAEANEEALRIVDRIRDRGVFSFVQAGFLECESPSISQAIELCVRAGARRITAVPCFLHVGAHVASDLPDAIDEAKRRFPEIEMRLGEYLGASDVVADILRDRARAAIAAARGVS